MNRFLIAAAFTTLAASPALAAASVPANHMFAWQENAGWMNWRDANGTTAGVRLRAGFLQGLIWCENIGWVSVGDGTPGVAGCSMYTNSSGADTGVNVLATGELTGFAWGENVGWINFDTRAALGAAGKQARWDAAAGRFRGYAWGENIGWVNLDDPTNYVASSAPCVGDVNGDGVVNFLDLNIVLSFFGQSAAPGGCIQGDTNGDNAVNFLDLNNVLSFFGTNC